MLMNNAEGTPEINPETLALIFEITREGPLNQIRDIDGFDTKLFQGFSVASIIIGLASFVGIAGGSLATVLLTSALVAYIVGAIAAIAGLWPRTARGATYAGTLWRDFWNATANDVRHAIVQDVAEAYDSNRRLLALKSVLLRSLLGATAAETFLVGAALIYARLA